MNAPALLTTALAALLAGCVVTRQESQTPPVDVPPVIGVAEGVWRVVADGELIGYVRRYEAAGPASGLPREATYGPWYAVQNRWAQELGMIDELGRAWRLRPHRLEPDWIGTGTVVDGVAEVLGVDGEVVLEPADEPPR